MKNKFGVWAVVIIIVLAVVMLLANDRGLFLAPKGASPAPAACQLDPLTDCINDCLTKYNNAKNKIDADYQSTAMACCKEAGGDWFLLPHILPPIPNYGYCTGNYDLNIYNSCRFKIDWEGLQKNATEDFNKCLDNCMNQFCGTSTGE